MPSPRSAPSARGSSSDSALDRLRAPRHAAVSVEAPDLATRLLRPPRRGAHARRPDRRPLVKRFAAVVGVAGLVLGLAGVVYATGGLRSTPHHGATEAVKTTTLARPADNRASRSVPPVERTGPLRLTRPDVIVLLPKTADPRSVHRLAHSHGVTAVAVLSRGTVTMRGAKLTLVGADTSMIRGFTPILTARSDALWQSVDDGNLTLSYSRAGRMRPLLGATVPVRGAYGFFPERIGAFASLGLGRADGLVDAGAGASLGLRPGRELVIGARRVDLDTLRARITRLFGAHVHIYSLRPRPVNQAVISAYARATIPPAYLTLYRKAASTCTGLPWTVLAAIGAVETGHGADTRVSSKGAMGPMQFLPSTFVAYAVDGNGDGVADIRNPSDAVYTAAHYLCLWGAGLGGQSLYDAIFAYNHADWYVRKVIALAVAYS